MQAVIPFPDISPEIFTISLGSFQFALRWYALAYLAGIALGWLLGRAALRRPGLWPRDRAPMSTDTLGDLVTWLIAGVIIGGRLGFVLFYQPAYYMANPLEIPMIWQGGMAFHGGLIGVAVTLVLYARAHGLALLPSMDLLALCTPFGLLFGRIANFINAELWGRPTDVAWGVIFPGAAAQNCPGVVGPCARHPSQLYEAGLEGLLLGAIVIGLAFGSRVLRHPGRLTGIFIAGYGLARTFVEMYRLADPQFITPGNPHGHVLRFSETLGLTMGQMLSLPMVLIGLGFILWSFRPRGAAAA